MRPWVVAYSICGCYSAHVLYSHTLHLYTTACHGNAIMAMPLPSNWTPNPIRPQIRFRKGLWKTQSPTHSSILEMRQSRGLIPHSTRPKGCIDNVPVPGTTGHPQRSPLQRARTNTITQMKVLCLLLNTERVSALWTDTGSWFHRRGVW